MGLSIAVWKELKGMIGNQNVWVGESIEVAFQNWCDNKDLKRSNNFP